MNNVSSMLTHAMILAVVHDQLESEIYGKNHYWGMKLVKDSRVPVRISFGHSCSLCKAMICLLLRRELVITSPRIAAEHSNMYVLAIVDIKMCA